MDATWIAGPPPSDLGRAWLCVIDDAGTLHTARGIATADGWCEVGQWDEGMPSMELPPILAWMPFEPAHQEMPPPPSTLDLLRLGRPYHPSFF